MPERARQKDRPPASVERMVFVKDIFGLPYSVAGRLEVFWIVPALMTWIALEPDPVSR